MNISERRKLMYTTKSQYIQLNDNSIYVETIETSKDKPAIVFLHDSLGCVALWRDFPKKVSEATGCNVLVYDRLGYGKSDPMATFERQSDYLEIEADFLMELLAVMQLSNVILLGHSDGGSIALITAAKYSSVVNGVICEAAHIFVEDVTLDGIVEAIHSYETTNLAQRLEKYHGDKVDMLFKAWTKTWTSAGFKHWNIEHFLKDIMCPLLFIQGEKDEFGSMLQVKETIRQVSGYAQSFIVPNTGHTPHKEAPEITFDAVSTFVKTLL